MLKWRKDRGGKEVLIELFMAVCAVAVIILFRPQLTVAVQSIFGQTNKAAVNLGVGNIQQKPYESDKGYFEDDPHFVLNWAGELVGQCYDLNGDNLCDYCGATLYDKDAPHIIINNPASDSPTSPTLVTDEAKPHTLPYRVTGDAHDGQGGVRDVWVSVNGSEYAPASYDHVTDEWYYDITLTENERAAVSAYGRDFKGNLTATVTHYVLYDTSVPIISITDPTENPKYISGENYVIKGQITEIGSGLASATITYTPSSGAQITDGLVLDAEGKFSYTTGTLSANSTTIFTFNATDKAGLPAASVTCRIFRDTQAPSVTVNPAYSSTSETSPKWLTSKNFTMSGSVTDNGSAIESVSYKYPLDASESTITFSLAEHRTSYNVASTTQTLAEGTVYRYGIRATDHVGRETVKMYYICADVTAPSITNPTYRGTNINSYTSTTSPYTMGDGSGTVSVTVTDNVSGVASVKIDGVTATKSGNTYSANITLPADTTKALVIESTDVAGNTTSITRYLHYNTDTTAPTIVVNNLGTSSGSPYYIQSDAATNYTVSGTWSDPSGISSIKVNGLNATVNSNGTWSCQLSNLATNTTHTVTVDAVDNSTKKNSTGNINRYLRVECYYQQAEREAGVPLTNDLPTLLRNDSSCNIIAGNSRARTIINERYRSSVKSYVTNNSYWSEGLNTLAYNTNNTYYVFHGEDTNVWSAGLTSAASGWCSWNGPANGADWHGNGRSETRSFSVASGQRWSYTSNSAYSFATCETIDDQGNPDRKLHTTWPITIYEGSVINTNDNQYYCGLQGQVNKGFKIYSGYNTITITATSLRGYQNYSNRFATVGLSTSKSAFNCGSSRYDEIDVIRESSYYTGGLYKRNGYISSDSGSSCAMNWTISGYANSTMYLKMQASHGNVSVSYIYLNAAN